MRRWINRKRLIALCLAAVLAAEVFFLTDAAVVFFGKMMPILVGAGLLAGLTGLFYVAQKRFRRTIIAAIAIIPAVLALVALVLGLCWQGFSTGAAYECRDEGKRMLYADQKVMLIVPHQDDDLNILGGVMEEYVRYGSEMTVVFVTNGDYADLAETRYREALDVLLQIGIPEDHVVFLGYGDGWQGNGPHIYNAASGQVMESHVGYRKTYGTSVHPAYREGKEYTIDNLIRDMQDVILEYRPNVIFCSDYDNHVDHKAVSLLFDKTMGLLLKENPEYKPQVYKAYAYGTAWEAEPDFYEENVLSTRNLFEERYGQNPAVYRWEERIRFPVEGGGLSRSLLSSRTYTHLKGYDSQGAASKAASIINGDKVAWYRPVTSLTLHAGIAVSSGDGSLLNDFMLMDNSDLADEKRNPYDGVWIPDEEDEEKSVTVQLQEPSDIAVITLYDHPSERRNVLNARIRFDDGTEMETGPLDPGGAATRILADKSNVSSFSVALIQTEGNAPGLSEVEAFMAVPEPEIRFIKLMDQEGNFLYDYWTGKDGTEELQLYTCGVLPELTRENYTVRAVGDGTAILENGAIRVTCDPGAEFTLNVTCSVSGVSDHIVIRNPGSMERFRVKLWQNIEKTAYFCYSDGIYKNLVAVRLFEKVSYVLRHML